MLLARGFLIDPDGTAAAVGYTAGLTTATETFSSTQHDCQVAVVACEPAGRQATRFSAACTAIVPRHLAGAMTSAPGAGRSLKQLSSRVPFHRREDFGSNIRVN